MWEDLIMKAKEGGLDVVETYVFWNVHEPSQGNVWSFICAFFVFLRYIIFILSPLYFLKLS